MMMIMMETGCILHKQEGGGPRGTDMGMYAQFVLVNINEAKQSM